ncbi:beta strand repeat-containing protein [Oleiharenicola lentus]|uniref:beta strand repeat-containing protein n=1 Tax=Oleiharenicola lentus TaxID=2508720 RepID=UPI003F67FF69
MVFPPLPLTAGISASGVYPLLPNPPPMSWTPSMINVSVAGEPDSSGGIGVTDGSSINANIIVADGPGSIASLTVQDTDSVINGAVIIGDGGQVLAPNGISYIDVGGTGSLLVRNGGRISGDMVFAAKLNSVGTGLIENAGTVVASETIQVGNYGNGSLTIRDSAEVTGVVDVGHFRAGVGEIIVTGSGSKLTSGSSIYGSGNVFLLGSAGKGTLRVEAGGYVSAINATLGEFYNSGKPSGQATITGAGSTWEIFDTLVVGADSHGDNSVTVENGGLLRTSSATISWGRAAANSGNGLSRGQVTVTGAGSTWINESGPLVIGGGGLATLTIANGGTLTNSSLQSAVIGNVGVATTDDEITGNSVLVTGAGSTWTNAGDLKIGYRTRGTVEIAAGGKITATEVSLDGFRYQSPSLLILRGDSGARGVLETGMLTEGPGPGGGSIAGSLLDYGGAVRFDGGILRATRHEADFIRNFEDGEITITSNGAWLDTNGFNVGIGANLSGTGGLTKIGAGTLTITGTSSFTGPTSVNAGKLVVNGSLTTSAVTVASGASLGGGGTIGTLTLNSGSTLTPGNSPGELTAGNTTWEGGANYEWEINDAASPATGAGARYDLLAISGTLTINATAENKFTLLLTSLLANNTAGDVMNFNSALNSAYTIASATGGIFGFDANAFQINSTGFTNQLNGGSWNLSQDGNTISLNFIAASAIPEPSTYAAIAGIAALGLAAWRRRAVKTKMCVS